MVVAETILPKEEGKCYGCWFNMNGMFVLKRLIVLPDYTIHKRYCKCTRIVLHVILLPDTTNVYLMFTYLRADWS